MRTPQTTKHRCVAASAGILAATGMLGLAGGMTAEAATVLTFSPLPQRMESALQGTMCSGSNTCQQVDYSFSLPLSVERISDAIAAAVAVPEVGDPAVDEIVVFGLSGGAGASSNWLRDNAADIDAPSPDRLSFVMIGNPNRKYGGSSRRFATTPQTQYHVIDIARQYDPIADSPDDPFNLLAHLNVMAGIFSPLHTDYSTVDINDPNNIRWTEGNTTYILVPTEKLPLLGPLRAMGLNRLADSLNGPLKEIIERAYNRPVPVPLTLEPPDEPQAVTASTTSDVPAHYEASRKALSSDPGQVSASELGEAENLQRVTATQALPTGGDDDAVASDDADALDDSTVGDEVLDDSTVGDDVLDDSTAGDEVLDEVDSPSVDEDSLDGAEDAGDPDADEGDTSSATAGATSGPGDTAGASGDEGSAGGDGVTTGGDGGAESE